MLSQVNAVNKRVRSSELAIRIKMDDSIGMNKTVMETLNRPANLHFWWSESDKVLAISSVIKPTNTSVPVPDFFYNTRNGSKIRNWKLMRAIKALTGWEDNSVHLLVGSFLPDLNIIAFLVGRAEMEDEK